MNDFLEDIVGDESDEELEYQFIRCLLMSSVEKFVGLPLTENLYDEVRETMIKVLTDYDRQRNSV